MRDKSRAILSWGAFPAGVATSCLCVAVLGCSGNDDGGSAAGQTGGSAGISGNGGSSGASGSGTAGSSSAGASGTAGSSANAGSSGASGAGSSGASGAGAASCEYPATSGEFGAVVGAVVPGSLQWQGFAENTESEGTVRIADYFDCDGSKGIHALLLDTSATWCFPCKGEAQDIHDKVAESWGAKGIRVITLMFEDASNQPAVVDTARDWRDTYQLQATAVVADPDFSFAPPGNSYALPFRVVVDPRTMKIVAIPEKIGDETPILEDLAAQNSAP